MDKEKIERIKKHSFYLALLLIILLIYLSTFIINIKSAYLGEYMFFYPTRAEIYRLSVEEYQDFLPLWQPFTMSGEPHFAEGGTQVFYLITLLSFIIPNSVVVIKIAAVISLFFVGISMYALVFYLLKKHKFAFISALLFVFNGWTISKFKVAHLTTLSALPFLPLIILFTLKATKSKEWIKYSVITGLLFSIQIFAGPDLKVTLWTVPLFVLCLLFYTIGKRFSKRLTKVIFIWIIVFSVIAGVTAIQILPTKEYVDMSSRARMDFKLTLAGGIKNIKEGFTTLIEPIYEGMPKIRSAGGLHIGIVGFMLMILSIWKKLKNKNVLLFISMALFSLFIVSNLFSSWYLMWKYVPAYSSFRYLHRTVVMFVFAASVLAAYGMYALFNIVEKKGWSRNKQNLLFLFIISLIILNLLILGNNPYRTHPWRESEEVRKENHILQHLSKQEGIFRVHVLETTGIDWNTEHQMVPLGLKNIYGGSGMWVTEYMNEYLSITLNQPAKFWGVLNVKYLTSQNEINKTGFRFMQKFDRCEICWPEEEKMQKIWGPYLYENELFLPNAYITNNAILIIGEKNAAKQTMYGLMLNENFDPSKIIVVLGDKTKVSDYKIDFLKRFNFIFLAQDSISSNNDVFILKQYVENGGTVLPNVIEGQNAISEEDIDNIFDYFESKSQVIEDDNVIIPNFDTKEVKLNNNKGNFLVLSERYSLFPGWKAKVNNKNLKILRTNGVVSSVYLDDNYASVVFEYKPRSFTVGLAITIITLSFIFGYFIFIKIKKKNQITEQK